MIRPKNYLHDYKSDDKKKRKKKSIGGSISDSWQQKLDPMQRLLEKLGFTNSLLPAEPEPRPTVSENLYENPITLQDGGQSSVFNLPTSTISYPGSENYQPIYTFENKDADAIVSDSAITINPVDMEAVLKQQEDREKQEQRERWEKMSLYDILKELGYTMEEVY